MAGGGAMGGSPASGSSVGGAQPSLGSSATPFGASQSPLGAIQTPFSGMGQPLQVPDWVQAPDPGMATGEAFTELTNPATGEKFIAPNTGYSVRQQQQPPFSGMGQPAQMPINMTALGANPMGGAAGLGGGGAGVMSPTSPERIAQMAATAFAAMPRQSTGQMPQPNFTSPIGTTTGGAFPQPNPQGLMFGGARPAPMPQQMPAGFGGMQRPDMGRSFPMQGGIRGLLQGRNLFRR